MGVTHVVHTTSDDDERAHASRAGAAADRAIVDRAMAFARAHEKRRRDPSDDTDHAFADATSALLDSVKERVEARK